jgi:hypothetical protein
MEGIRNKITSLVRARMALKEKKSSNYDADEATSPTFELKKPNRTCQATTLPFARNDAKRSSCHFPHKVTKILQKPATAESTSGDRNCKVQKSGSSLQAAFSPN